MRFSYSFPFTPDPESILSPTLESFSVDNSSDTFTHQDEESFSWNDEDDEEFLDPSKKEPSFLKSEQMALLMARQNETVLSLMGHNFEDMVLSCTYRGVSCR